MLTTNKNNEQIRFVVDRKRILVGCPLIQAAMGGDKLDQRLFPVELWATDITPETRLFIFRDMEQFDMMRKQMFKHHGLKI